MQPEGPPGEIPLIEGLDSSWNEIVNYIPEDKRSEFTPVFKERLSSFEKTYEPLKQWEDLQKSGVTPDHASTALSVFAQIENNPREVYDTLAKYLDDAKDEIEEEIEGGNPDEDRIAELQRQIDTLSQIALAQRQMTEQEKQAQEQDKALEQEISELKKKHGDFPEDEVLMRMMQKDMTAEAAFDEYSNRVHEIRKRRPSPMIMGQGGSIPPRKIDPVKLNSKDTKALVAQMFEHANQERNA